MEMTADIALRGTAWEKAIDGYSEIFVKRTNYDVYMLSLAIGIMYDKRIDHFDEETTINAGSVPRNVIQNNDRGKLDMYFQAAILSTTTLDLPENERLELAFGEKTEFNKIGLLTEFANYGVTKLADCVGTTTIETMDNLKCFLVAKANGNNEVEDLQLDYFELD